MNHIYVTGPNELEFLGQKYTCAIGKHGFTDTPQEGAKKTPLGSFYLRECWYRPDRVTPPETKLKLRPIAEDDGWCDAPEHKDYNKHVKLPFPASHEKLWREDHMYDIIVPIGFNDTEIVPGKGSAIFFHLAKPDYSPTLGCVAISLEHMLEILRTVDETTLIVINPVRP
ncbi:MAG TPA: L,D-transpeptidase family protein [Rickettsiales bacterium]|nr:L,D-transpeptidase family protein [Rickettsiales bacterium]